MARKARLEDELIGLERITPVLAVALERAGDAPDEFAARAVASDVDDFDIGGKEEPTSSTFASRVGVAACLDGIREFGLAI